MIGKHSVRNPFGYSDELVSMICDEGSGLRTLRSPVSRFRPRVLRWKEARDGRFTTIERSYYPAVLAAAVGLSLCLIGVASFVLDRSAGTDWHVSALLALAGLAGVGVALAYIIQFRRVEISPSTCSVSLTQQFLWSRRVQTVPTSLVTVRIHEISLFALGPPSSVWEGWIVLLTLQGQAAVILALAKDQSTAEHCAFGIPLPPERRRPVKGPPLQAKEL
jgi:hypothetical protein